jgi:hypothetical protein
MRRYDIVTGVLLILSFIDFALAAPVLVQEKRARVNVAKIPESVTTVMGKRWGEELEKLGEEYFKTSGKTIDSSGTHFSSSSAPPGPSGIDHGSTNDVQSPTQNSASSTSNPDQLPCCSPMQGLSARGNANSCRQNCVDLMEEMSKYDVPMHPGPMATYGVYHKLPYEPPEPQWIPMTGTKPSPDPNFDWEHWANAEDPPPSSPALGPARPKVSHGQASGYAPGPPPTESVVPSPSPGAESPIEPENEVVPGPRPSPNPELQLDDQSLSADSPVDLLAAINRVKGKAKELRHISGTTRDIGNAA